jgi:hypothetical protein|tara:strand:- start:106 stop:339 length:234 start_codon:yes stop_codon:yes gene_type:complete
VEKKTLDKILCYIRENMVANAPGAQGGFGSSSNAAGPTAGYDKKIGKVRKRYTYGGHGSRKNWLDYLKKQNGRTNQG